MLNPAVALALAGFVLLILRYANRTDIPKIKGLPEVGGGVPFFGHLFQLGEKHARVAFKWVDQYGPVFQVRLGNRRIVFANTFESVKSLWIHNQSALISRPTLHTFHTVVSSSQGFTIGTSPWDESCKNRRKAAATALNKPAVQTYMPIIDLESTVSIKELLEDSKRGDVDPNAYFARYSLNTSLTLNYGYRIPGNVDDELLREITTVERSISNFRSTSNNWQDYVPLLRLLPNKANRAGEIRERRDVYMTKLLNELKQRIDEGKDQPCITGNILKDPDAKLNEAEIKSICLTMVSAGLDTVPGNLVMCLAWLSSSDEGQKVQEKAFEEIQKVYPDGDGWSKCLVEERVSYITALVKEVLRFWTVIPICLPRVSTKPIEWRGAVIPAGTTFYMNAYAADYDGDHFKDPFKFMPERYLDPTNDVAGTPHYGYGAGSRMCAGSHLANRELYTAFLRLILAFRFKKSQNIKDRPILDCLDCNQTPTSLTMDPMPFKCGFEVRDKDQLERWIKESEESTKHL